MNMINNTTIVTRHITTGKFLRLSLEGNDYLQLEEVEVEGVVVGKSFILEAIHSFWMRLY